MHKKGSAVMSETMLNVITIVISFILIVVVIFGIFSGRTEKTTKSIYEGIPREISSLIDRTAALAGSQEYEYDLPKGVNVNISIGYKKVYLTYDKGSVDSSFSGLIHTGPYKFINPKKLCIVKNRDDRRIMVSSGSCSCDPGNGVCDPECIFNGVCDPDCKTETKDFVCNKFCADNGDGICDPDCNRAEVDKVCDYDCIKEGETNGICDPDCDNVKKGICDLDCVEMYNGTKGVGGICDPDCKPVDKNSDGIEDKKDGYCYAGCIETVQNYTVHKVKAENYTCQSSSGFRCGGFFSVYNCGKFVKNCTDDKDWPNNYCLQRNWSEEAGCAKDKGIHLSDEEIQEYETRLNNWTVCCCDMNGSCSYMDYLTCGESGRQSYPMNHPYCKGLGKKVQVIKLKKDGICDLDCNETNNICDPDCRLDEDCEEKCAKEGESCIDIPCCSGYVCCPGTKLCAKEKSYEPACCGDKKCDVSPIVGKMYEMKDAVKWCGPFGCYRYKKQKPWSYTSNPENWENYYTCKEDCMYSVDLVCSRPIYPGDVDCSVIHCKSRPGKYDCCCAYYSLHYPGTCPYTTYEQTRKDGICMQMDDGKCDPDCVNDNTSCDPDCCSFNSPVPCPSSPGCYCPVRVKRGPNVDGGPYFTNTDLSDWTKHVPHLTKNVVGVCSDAAIKFLDRRGWDIKQVEVGLQSPDPLGFAFDQARYGGGGAEDITRTGAYNASKTIIANEKYNLTKHYCSSILESEKDICAGVGFCGDHAIAIMSILRTLGVPPYDVYAAFSSNVKANVRHAYVLYYCDPELPYNQKLMACKGNWNKWMIIDATHHYIAPFEGTALCDHLCFVWNDYGYYPLLNSTKYGFEKFDPGGLVNEHSGYPFPVSGPRKMNCKTDPSCVLNTNEKQRPGMCQLMKGDMNFRCIE